MTDVAFIKLVNMSISSGFIVLAVMMLRLLLKKTPKFIVCLLWLAVGIRLVCPVSPESVFSLIPSPETIPAEIIYAKTPEIHTGFPALNMAVNPIITESLAPDPFTSINPVQILIFLAKSLWGLGLAVMLLYALISYLRILYKTRESVILEGEKGVKLCDRIPSPFILGIIKPTIFVPVNVKSDDLPYILAHERAHLKRLDHLWKPLGFLLLAVYWFNPLMWLAYILMCKDIEYACDEKVIKSLGASAKKPYSEALLDCSVSLHSVSACPLAFGEGNTGGRIKSVLNYKKPAVWIVAVSVVIVCIIAVCFLTNPEQDKDVEENIPVSVQPISGKLFGGENLVFSCGIYSSIFYTDENIPQYYIDENMNLYTTESRRNRVPDKNGFYLLGTLESAELTQEAFDGNIMSLMWDEGYNAETLRKENKNAFVAVDEESGTYYYVLEQRNGDVFITYGYLGENNEYGNIRYIFKMRDKLMRESTGFIDATVLVYRNSVDFTDPTIVLEKDGTFTFTWSLFSSYIAHGKYELAGDMLTLKTDDGNNTYVFKNYGYDSRYHFSERDSSPIPKYKYGENEKPRSPVPDGAGFDLVPVFPEFTAVIDSATGDVDGDGTDESCSLNYGHTSGLFSFIFNMQKNDGEAIRSVFVCRHFKELSFAENENGRLLLKAVTDSGGEYTFDIGVDDGNITLTETTLGMSIGEI